MDSPDTSNFTIDARVGLPIVTHGSPGEFDPERGPDASRHSVQVAGGTIETLFHRKRGDVLLIGFHGALDRQRYETPRFERLRTLERRNEPFLLVADPLLETSAELKLGWYVGRAENPIPPIISAISSAAAEACGATRTLFLGSSGGGFAAMRISALTRDSMALAFSPQTQLSSYYRGPVTQFVEACFGEFPEDWEGRLGARASLISTYQMSERNNLVWYIQNRLDPFHLNNHCAPFAAAMGFEPEGTSPRDDIHMQLIDSREGHHPPTDDEFTSALQALLDHSRRQ